MAAGLLASVPAGLIRRGVLLAVFLLLLAWQFSMHAPLVMADAPYEGWDEIATYNTARLPSTPKAVWPPYHYGSLESFTQFLGLQYFLWFDPGGYAFEHYNYSNNDPESLNDRFFVYKKITPKDFLYGYFRGVDDHRPIFLSRELHFYACYALVGVTGILSIALLAVEAIWLIVPMLCLTVTAEAFLQAALALPNMINTLLSFVIVVLIGFAMKTRQAAPLYLASAAIAVAFNFKIDVVPLGAILGLALIWCGASRGFILTIRRAVIAFLTTLIATNPWMLIDPRMWLWWLTLLDNRSNQPLSQTVSYNLSVFIGHLKTHMLPAAWQDHVPSPVLPLALLGGVAVVTVALRREPSVLRRLIVPGLAVLVLWLAPITVVRQYYPRYDLNGLAALYALIALALLSLSRHGGRFGRGLAALILAVLVGQYCVMAGDGVALASRAAVGGLIVAGDDHEVFAKGQSRNIIELQAVDKVLAGGFDRTVLVDQHAYLDLRLLRLSGLDTAYVNMDTLDDVLAHLEGTLPHLVIYSAGSYDVDPSWKPWMTEWSPEVRQRYDFYRTKLSSYPVHADTGGPPQPLLWVGPVGASDRMMLAAVPARSGAPP